MAQPSKSLQELIEKKKAAEAQALQFQQEIQNYAKEAAKKHVDELKAIVKETGKSMADLVDLQPDDHINALTLTANTDGTTVAALIGMTVEDHKAALEKIAADRGINIAKLLGIAAKPGPKTKTTATGDQTPNEETAVREHLKKLKADGKANWVVDASGKGKHFEIGQQGPSLPSWIPRDVAALDTLDILTEDDFISAGHIIPANRQIARDKLAKKNVEKKAA